MDEAKEGNILLKICAFIVDKRNLFFLIYALLMIFSAASSGWVEVINDLAAYLPDTTETRQGLDIMEEEFVTFGSANLMIANVSYDQALSIQEDLESIDGVFRVVFDDTTVHYNESSALYEITFEYPEDDDRCLESLELVEEYAADMDSYMQTDLGNIQAELIAEEMKVISVLVVIIVVTVLLLTSQSYAEVPVLLITFGSAALVQMGTNFLLGSISFVSNSVTIVLQLALSVDYAVILLNRYKEELEFYKPREAVITALTKAIPEISGSSLTTMGGLIAMMFMQYGIGADLGIVLIKAIVLSLLSVFTLMPGIIMLFSDAMKATEHRNFIPEIPFVGRFAYRTRYIMTPLFFIVIIIASQISSKCEYVFGYSKITPPLTNDVEVAKEMQRDYFDTKNMLAIVVPAGDYEAERELLKNLESYDEVYSTTGLVNTAALGGYNLADALTPRQFSELLDLDYETVMLVYTAYAIDTDNYARVVNGLANYSVPLIDMFEFVYKEVKQGYVTLDDDVMAKLEDADRLMGFARDQLSGENYSRMLVYLNLPEETQETFDFLDTIHSEAERYYDADRIYTVGQSVSDRDLSQCFARDNQVVSIISILCVLAVLLFTFKSVGMPLLLILVIQGSIWINFSVPTLQHDYLFFLGYLIVSSIQMGSNIDYAIVIASRYMDLRKSMLRKETVIKTMNQSFPTIITSGTMLAVAGILIGRMTSDAAIYGIGKSLGRGTIISLIITMFVLPQILLGGDRIIEKTAFSVGVPTINKQQAARILAVILAAHTLLSVWNTTVYAEEAAIEADAEAEAETEFYDASESEALRETSVAGLPVTDAMAEELAYSDETDEDEEETALDGQIQRLIDTEWEYIHITSADELMEFAKNAVLDTWSYNKHISIDNDISLSGSGFTGIAMFNGIFDGNGHTISGVDIDDDRSYSGFFNYIGEDAVVRDIKIEGSIAVSSGKLVTGGIAAQNYGVISGCEFDGDIKGYDYAGGIVGINELSGKIYDCKTSGTIYGKHSIGGIAGDNRGYINRCANDALINMTHNERELSLLELGSELNISDILNPNGGADMSDYMIGGDVYDIGGITGRSTGVVAACTNNGDTGYEHVGYNVGGIVGRGSGYVYNCVNNAHILGRKDVGGIEGQAEPYIYVDIDAASAASLEASIGELHDLINATLRDTDSSVGTITDRLSIMQTYTGNALSDTAYLAQATVDTANGVSTSVNNLYSKVDNIMNEAQRLEAALGASGISGFDMLQSARNITGILDGINLSELGLEQAGADAIERHRAAIKAAQSELEGYYNESGFIIQAAIRFREAHGENASAYIVREGEAVVQTLKNALPNLTADNQAKVNEVINSLSAAEQSLKNAEQSISNLLNTENVSFPSLGDEYKQHTASLSDNLKGMNDNFGMLISEIRASSGTLTNDLIAVNNQLEKVMGLFSDLLQGLAEINTDDIYEDESLAVCRDSVDATIADCENHGVIEADIDAAGIVGAMALDTDIDILENADREIENISQAFRSTLLTRCVLRGNFNDADVIATKDYTGGVCGRQSIGAIIDCKSYGDIESSAGSYVGGIAGMSKSYILSSAVRGTVSASTYVGGIAGSGNNIYECVSIINVEDAADWYGAIAGQVEETSSQRNNYFVSDELAGINRVSYTMRAQPVTAEELSALSSEMWIPSDLFRVKVSFVLEDDDETTLISTKHIAYGDSIGIEDLPELEAPEGYYVVWDETEREAVTNDVKLTASFVPYITTLAGEETDASGQSYILANGSFVSGDELIAERLDIDNYFSENVIDAYRLVIPDDGNEIHTIRYALPPEIDKADAEGAVYAEYLDGDVYKRADNARLMGRYLLFDVAGSEPEFRIIWSEMNVTFAKYIAILIAIIVAVIAVIIISVLFFKKKKQAISINIKKAFVSFREIFVSQRHTDMFYHADEDASGEEREGIEWEDIANEWGIRPEDIVRHDIEPDAAETEKLYGIAAEVLGDTSACNKASVVSEEIFMNIAEYSGAQHVSYACVKTQDGAVVIFWDDGMYYDPTKVKDGDMTVNNARMGLKLVRKLAAQWIYTRKDGENCQFIRIDGGN